MTETDLADALHRCIDDCGYSWPTACQIVSRMAGRRYTVAELREMYRTHDQIRRRLWIRKRKEIDGQNKKRPRPVLAHRTRAKRADCMGQPSALLLYQK